MRIGILGSGLMGGKLGTIFARAGHDVVFSYSHSKTKLEKLARDAGGQARAGTPAEAAKDADALLLAVFARTDPGARPSIVYCGDNAKAKKLAAQLITDAGFEPIDAGPLRIARYTEPFTLLVGQLAYEGDRGPAMAYRFEWFEECEA
jgi:predicted dinucleotide-binding enzyme